ncbi:ABC transporter C family member 4-like protein [Corchorus olitorius]|uniref:ABC transporter C family member 4-like protein n=1 Tax=Corchorus olitorius TaxID=93759 RepID=A0A1R3HLQ4_9ROSI|nr:ABC transporter C family member 4-like protein [Corchorus olitorius]
MPEHKSTVDSLEISSLAPTHPPDSRSELLLTENPTNLSKSSRPETEGKLSDPKSYPSVYIIALPRSLPPICKSSHRFTVASSAGGKFGGIRMELLSCQPELDRAVVHLGFVLLFKWF